MSSQTISIEQLFNASYASTTSLPLSSIVAANADPLSLSDIRRIFDGKRVVVAGDSQMRSIYRDLATYLVTGHRLCASFIAIHTDKKLTPKINECRLRVNGRPGTMDYTDERVCQWSPTSSLHYIFLPSLGSPEVNELLHLVQHADLLIFSSERSDMSWKILDNSPIPFAEHLNNYASKVFSLCQRIVEVTESTSYANAEPLLLWLTPIPLGQPLSHEQKNQFLQIVAAGENSAKMAGFRLFDQLNVSLVDGGKFASNKYGHFSSIGIRLVTTLLAEIAADHWKRPLRLLTSSSSPPRYSFNN